MRTRHRLAADSRVTRLDARDCRPPLEVFRDLSANAGVAGSVLMESAARGGPGGPGGTRSLLVPGGACRLVAREGDVALRPLGADGELVVSALGETAHYPRGVSDEAVPDEDRIRSENVLDSVRRLLDAVEDRGADDGFPIGVYGALSFELVDQWEDLPPRPAARGHRVDAWREPDIQMVLALDAVVYNHVSREVVVVTRSIGGGASREAADGRHAAMLASLTAPSLEPRSDGEEPSARVEAQEAEPDVEDAAYLASVRKLLDHIERGDIFQGVLSRGLTMRSEASPLAVYDALRERNPSPYMFYVELDDGAVVGASPETCLKVESGRVSIRPIAGTAPRGLYDDGSIDEEYDTRLAVGMLLDEKEQAEHAMLVDLARNDVARVSVPGTRRVVDPFAVEKYSHVQHLVSGVDGELAPDLDALHAYRAAANMGTLTGAPKLRAMELIRETEPFARGLYGGAVGYLLQDGTFDSCITIRSLRSRSGGIYQTRAGAGIVADSVPERELAETEHKARACREALAAAGSAS